MTSDTLAKTPDDRHQASPYTFFREQVRAGNVGDVTSHGGAIQGTFKQEVTYPVGPERHIPLNPVDRDAWPRH